MAFLCVGREVRSWLVVECAAAATVGNRPATECDPSSARTVLDVRCGASGYVFATR
jgi:hypothetical protein